MVHRFSPSRALPGCVAVLALGLFPAPPANATPEEAGRAGPFRVQAIKDVAYHDGPGADPVKHRLDLFLPRGQKGFPVVLFVHGGAWLHGDKSFLGIYSAVGSTLARHGVGAVVINYRLSPAVRHPEHVKDVARAFAWTYRNIARYGGRPDQLFVCGHSAGAHLISLLVTDDSYLLAEGLTAGAVRGAIPLSGVYLIPEGLLPVVFGTDPGVRELASPIRHVRKGLPPFLILYADRDFPGCGREPSEAFCARLRQSGNAARTLEITESSHHNIILNLALPNSPVSQAVRRFIQELTAGQGVASGKRG